MQKLTDYHKTSVTQEKLVAFQLKSSSAFEIVKAESFDHFFLGWTCAELASWSSSWIEKVHADDRQKLLAHLSRISDEKFIQLDYRLSIKGQGFAWVRGQFMGMKGADCIQAAWQVLDVYPEMLSLEQRYVALLETIVESAHSLFHAKELGHGMSHVLAKVGAVTQVDRVYFIGLAETSSSDVPKCGLCASGSTSNFFAWMKQSHRSEYYSGHWLKKTMMDAEMHPIWSLLLDGQILNGDTEAMAPSIAACLNEQGIKSILLLPVIQNNQCFGVLGLENSLAERTWTDREALILGQLTMTLGVALKQFQVESRLSHYAFHDPLTELPNRALLLNRLDQCIKRKARHQCYSFAVLFLDLDRFKPINDRLGHEIGDRLLVQVAHRISHCIRPGDTVARLGGDEFVILLDDIADLSDAEAAVMRLRTEITRCFVIDGNEIFIDASVGVVLSSMEFKSAEAILQKADLAMYRAKNSGKGCYRVFENSMHSQMIQRSETESEMHIALHNKEFEVHYQPIIQLDSGTIKGFEALARWNHPEMGLLQPNKFIPIAEETGMIKELGMQVLQSACEQASHWQRLLPQYNTLTMNVNLSAKQFVQEGLIHNIEKILEQTNLPPACLHLELTESCIIRKDPETLSLIKRLRAIGIQIYLDDFGAGYSSLQYLNFFPLNGLKIDRMFTQKIPSSSETQAIVRSIVVMAQALNMDIVVEGIENNQQVEYLRNFSALSGQGFLFARPLTVDSAEELLIKT